MTSGVDGSDGRQAPCEGSSLRGRTVCYFLRGSRKTCCAAELSASSRRQALLLHRAWRRGRSGGCASQLVGLVELDAPHLRWTSGRARPLYRVLQTLAINHRELDTDEDLQAEVRNAACAARLRDFSQRLALRHRSVAFSAPIAATPRTRNAFQLRSQGIGLASRPLLRRALARPAERSSSSAGPFAMHQAQACLPSAVNELRRFSLALERFR
jgi:hypothetical protein